TLAIPTELDEAADVIIRGKQRAIDVGTVNGHAFFNVASIGLSSELAQKLDSGLKRRFGKLSYAVAAFKVLVSASRFRARITESDHTRIVRTYQIAIGNGVHYGGGNVIQE